MKVVVVDDSYARFELIRNEIANTELVKYIDLLHCDSADQGRAALLAPSDLLVLDVLIPKKVNGTPQALHSVNLLADICNPRKRYIRPGLIIGLTADVDELGVYQEEFLHHAAVVLRAGISDRGWLERLISQIRSLLGTEKKLSQQTKDSVLISVHGIRTYGKWQEELGAEVTQYSRSFELIEIKYGFLDLFSFSIPFLRRLVIMKMARRVRQSVQSHRGKEINLVAHSFGTLIVSEALKSDVESKSLANVILCGSPMRHHDDIEHIVAAARLTLNECGTRDFVLVAARLLLLQLGDAGRVGFQRENSAAFRNRYFQGGHGLYFLDFKKRGKFFNGFWLRTITSGEPPEPFDERENYLGEDLIDMAIKIGTWIKLAVYGGGGLIFISKIAGKVFG